MRRVYWPFNNEELEDVPCRVCGIYTTPQLVEEPYDDWWKKQGYPKVRYRKRYPEMDICIDCAMEDTEKELYG